MLILLWAQLLNVTSLLTPSVGVGATILVPHCDGGNTDTTAIFWLRHQWRHSGISGAHCHQEQHWCQRQKVVASLMSPSDDGIPVGATIDGICNATVSGVSDATVRQWHQWCLHILTVACGHCLRMPSPIVVRKTVKMLKFFVVATAITMVIYSTHICPASFLWDENINVKNSAEKSFSPLFVIDYVQSTSNDTWYPKEK